MYLQIQEIEMFLLSLIVYSDRKQKSNINIKMQQNYDSSFENEEKQRRMDLGYSCEVLSDGSKSDDDSECYIEDLQTPHAPTNAQESEYEPNTCFDINDPLRYFLETGEITPNEYDKWKLVNEEPRHHPQPKIGKQSKVSPDFGPGHNESDNDEDSEDDHGDNNEETVTVFGNGYSVLANEHTYPVDPWNSAPDPTPSNDRRYTEIATDGAFMRKRLTQSVLTGPGNRYRCKLSNSFELKLLWERFMITASQRFHPLQDLWQENVLMIYEALQDLVVDHSKIRNRKNNRGAWFPKDTPAPPSYHTTPIETLENTFETIGRMSRCIAEDFNTSSVVNYVEEFIMSLYREIEFNALVEAHENKISDAEWDKNAKQTCMEWKEWK